MKKSAKVVVASVQAVVKIVCPCCGQAIEINLEGLTSYKKEVDNA